MFPAEETTSSNRQLAPHSTRRRLKSPHHLSASPSRQRQSQKRLRPTPKPVEVFHKCYSEPIIFQDDESLRSLDSDEGTWFGRLHTLDDIILCTATSQTLASPTPHINAQEYQKDAKVLITVTVEGSPGPIKTLVRLGANVEDTIKLVIKKYGEEGRSPSLDNNATCSYDLYVSYFSLQSLNKSYAIGDVGSRSFYLRKSSKKSDDNGCKMLEVVHNKSISSSSGYEAVQGSQFSSKQLGSPVAILPPFIARKLNKFVRRVHRIFILLGCLHSR